MKIRYLFFLLIVISISGCRREQRHSANAKKHIPKHHANIKSDTLIVDHKTAVGVLISEQELEGRRKKYGDTAFYVGADDANYYNYLADSILEKKKLPVMSADGYKYIEFRQRNGERIIVKIDTLSDLITMYFFDPARSAKVVDETDIEDEYKNYFQ